MDPVTTAVRTNVTECVSCAHDILYTGLHELDDYRSWSVEALQHWPWCPWLATRGFRVEPSTKYRLCPS